MAHYDNFSTRRPTVLGRWIGVRATLELAKFAARVWPGATDILEIGPGRGVLARHYVQKGCRYLCYEPNGRLAEELSCAGFKVKARAVPPVDENDATFDLAIASHVLEHLNGPASAFDFVSELARVVRPGAGVILATPNYNYWGPLFYDCDYTHAFPVTPARIRQLFSDAGLETILVTNRYASLGWFPGWLCDSGIRALLLPLRMLHITTHRVLKAGMLFRPSIIALGRKR